MNQLLVRAFLALRFREEGQTLLEYGLIISLISVGSIALLSILGAFPGSIMSKVTTDF